MTYEYEVIATDIDEALQIIEKIKSSHQQLGDDVKIKTRINLFI